MGGANQRMLRQVNKLPALLSSDAQAETAASFGLLVLDSSGLIYKCGHAAARMLSGSVGDMEGMPICSLIPDLMPSISAPSFNARYLAHLSNSEIWRSFRVIDITGQQFSIELAMSKIDVGGSCCFLVHLRHPEAANSIKPN